MGDWTFFSNYGHVLVCLASHREVRLRDVAIEVGITERAVQKIVRDLQDEGYVTVTKQGRCNRYRINRRKSLRHGLQSHVTVGKLLRLTAKPPGARDDARVPAETGSSAEAGSVETPQQKSEKAPKRQLKESKASKKQKERAKPLDTRQQGSLF